MEERREQNPNVPVSKLAEQTLTESPRPSRRTESTSDRKLSLPANVSKEFDMSLGSAGEGSNFCDSASSLDAIEDIQAALRGHQTR